MMPTKWRKFSYLRGECLQKIYHDKVINRNNVMVGNKTIKNVLIIYNYNKYNYYLKFYYYFS